MRAERVATVPLSAATISPAYGWREGGSTILLSTNPHTQFCPNDKQHLGIIFLGQSVKFMLYKFCILNACRDAGANNGLYPKYASSKTITIIKICLMLVYKSLNS